MKFKRTHILICFIITALYLSGCESTENVVPDESSQNGTKDYLIEEDSSPEFIPVYLNDKQELIYTCEAEEGVFNGNVYFESDKAGHSGTGYVTGFEADDDACTVLIRLRRRKV